MDNSSVAVPSTAVKDQNNSKSTPKSESSEMETGDENFTPEASSAKAKPDTAVPDVPVETPSSTSSPLDEAKAGSQHSSTASNLYPVLSDMSNSVEVNSTSVTGADSSNVQPVSDGQKDSEPVLKQTDISSQTSSSNKSAADTTSQEKMLSKESSIEKAEISDDHQNLSPVNAESAAPTSESAVVTSAVATTSLMPSTSDAGAEGGGAIGGKNSSPSSHGESVYYVKWITFNGGKVPIITQNENGPCPLLALVNALLLKGKVRLAPMVEMITSEQLMAHLGDCVVESKPKNLDETGRANYEQNMQDAMDLMHKLQTGLDVNVKFTGVSDFEYTSECIIFDLLHIGLYHGWLVDPQNEEDVKAVGKCSYNQLVEKVIQHKQSENDDMVREALIAEQFLDRTAAQLTYHGLCELSSTVKEQELCVFFRNNHFNTLLKHNSELFLLVTDQGFLTESNVVWETLSNVDGDCHFVDANFCTYTKPQPSTDPIPSSPYSSGDEQINSDYQVALSLQHHDQQLIAEQEAAWGQFHNDFGSAQNSDHELAMRLQEEEDRRAAAALQQQRCQQGQGQVVAQGQSQGVAGAVGGDRRPREREERRDRKEGKDCCIL